ncbi:MAG: hypothetical protein A3E78_12020 [Alphaproteobacteria bacterium RIFCSPHIGHO2_12_FULL_63_12]|nr:MAG: hypothetical protein A3E78_12020 [Alphaproteobacteria bacterium RIFCSPHIGHO2_12_FULL_63_12]
MSIMTPEAAAERIRTLKPGQSFVYFSGDLAMEREHRKDDVPGRPWTTRAKALARLANFVLRAGLPAEFSFGDGVIVAGTGQGTLYRKRRGPHTYDYYFRKGGTTP